MGLRIIRWLCDDVRVRDEQVLRYVYIVERSTSVTELV